MNELKLSRVAEFTFFPFCFWCEYLLSYFSCV